MQLKLICVCILAGLIVAACAAPATPAVPTVQPTAPPATSPAIEPTTPPTFESPVSPIETPGAVRPGGGLISKPAATQWATAPQAALAARAALADQLKVDPDTIQLVSVEHVDWPNGCLGVQTPGLMCTMVITPGYKVVLEAGGKQYEFHTNESGDGVKLANATP